MLIKIENAAELDDYWIKMDEYKSELKKREYFLVLLSGQINGNYKVSWMTYTYYTNLGWVGQKGHKIVRLHYVYHLIEQIRA